MDAKLANLRCDIGDHDGGYRSSSGTKVVKLFRPNVLIVGD
jgi:hypothetical protein